VSDDVLKETSAAFRAEEYKSPYAALAEEIYRDRVIRARQTPPEEKFLAGEELFDYACSITLAGIQHQNPEFTAEECQHELRRRLKLRERMERSE
jgi:hypothetical protein